MIKNEKHNIYSIFSEKYGKMSKKDKNNENGSDIDEKGQIWWKMKKVIFSRFFQKNMEKCRKNIKMLKMGQILMKKVKFDGKWKK